MSDQQAFDKYRYGDFSNLDDLKVGDDEVATAITTYSEQQAANKKSRHWARTLRWIENILFSVGRHYVDDLLISRLARDADSGELSFVKESIRNIPRPTNDLLGRYIETNIALLTENRPRPRVTSKTDRAEDIQAATVSELTLEYLWEKLDMPNKHREIARLLLVTGTAWMELSWDDFIPRHMTVPQTETENTFVSPEAYPPIKTQVQRQITKLDEFGDPVYADDIEFGDVNARVVSPFEMHFPSVHSWGSEEMTWVMRQSYMPVSFIQNKYSQIKKGKKDGWFLGNLGEIRSQNIQEFPLWWWERLLDLVEGPGPSVYIGSPDQWEGFTMVRVFDRKPNPKWPKGRTVITAGSKVIYDSPKDVGARAYNRRWPSRWHPYTRYVWEPMPGNVYGRALITKLLPKIKRVNSIDTALIMWRRTVPIATWIVPTGAHPVEDSWFSQAGQLWEYDPRRTQEKEPKPIFPPPFPEAALREREQQLQEMESIAGTEEILRGQRPSGVNSAAMLETLRKQSLASRSATLQAWDESLQGLGSSILQEVILHVHDDPVYAERLRILAREKQSRLTLKLLSGDDLSDNVIVRVDTASMALVSKEARQAKALEFLQYGATLMQLPPGIRDKVAEELEYPNMMDITGPDVDRAKRLIALIKQNRFDRVKPFVQDDPQIFYDIFTEELKSDGFNDMSEQQQLVLLQMIQAYKDRLDMIQQQQFALQLQLQGLTQGGGGGKK